MLELRAELTADDTMPSDIEAILAKVERVPIWLIVTLIEGLTFVWWRKTEERDALADLLEDARLPIQVRAAAADKILEFGHELKGFRRLPSNQRIWVVVLRWLTEHKPQKEGHARTLLRDLLNAMPEGSEPRVLPRIYVILVTKAIVARGFYDLLIENKHRRDVWAAIPSLWEKVTTLSVGKRITLAEAFELPHEVYAASTLMTLFAQTPQAKTIAGSIGGVQWPADEWLFPNMLKWPITAERDTQLTEWFHGPYLPKPEQEESASPTD